MSLHAVPLLRLRSSQEFRSACHMKVQLIDVFDYDNEKNGYQYQSFLSSIIAEEESRESFVWPSSTTRDSLVTMRPVVVA